MPRIRTVKPELFSSPKLAQVPIEARYLLIGLISQADDEGRLQDSPRMLVGAVFPHDQKVTERKVDDWLDNLQKVHSIVRYKADAGRFIAVVGWLEHQKISHPSPSRFPAYLGNGSRESLEGVRA